MEKLVKDLEGLKLQQITYRVGLVHDPTFQKHVSKSEHVQNAQRTRSIIKYLKKRGITQNKKVKVIYQVKEADQQIINLCFSKAYIDNLRDKGKQQQWIDQDTYFNSYSFSASKKAVQALIQAVLIVIKKQAKSAFAIVRPPGHHAGQQSIPQGFCIFNNVAIAARYSLKYLGLKKICIFDWDVHHGDGTQHIFYKQKQVLFCSFHEWNDGKFYPSKGKGAVQNSGQQQGEGYTVNFAINADQQKYGNSFVKGVMQVLYLPIIKQFKPQLILVSAGFDSFQGDPLGDLHITKQGYQLMTRELMKIGPVVCALQGGYNLRNLQNGVQGVIQAMLQDYTQTKIQEKCPPRVQERINKAKQYFSQYWSSLKN